MQTKTIELFLNKRVVLLADVGNNKIFKYAGRIVEIDDQDVLFEDDMNGQMAITASNIVSVSRVEQ